MGKTKYLYKEKSPKGSKVKLQTVLIWRSFCLVRLALLPDAPGVLQSDDIVSCV